MIQPTVDHMMSEQRLLKEVAEVDAWVTVLPADHRDQLFSLMQSGADKLSEAFDELRASWISRRTGEAKDV